MKWGLLLLLVSGALWAAPKEVLNERLALTQGFSAQFTQQVVSPDGEVIMQGRGQLAIARPGLFRWESQEPEQELIVSDGKTLWYYSPFIEQVTLYDPQQVTTQTPFVLLTHNRASDWDHYQITFNDELFTLRDVQAPETQYQLKIDPQGKIHQFVIIEQDGQRSEFQFSQWVLAEPEHAQFHFKVPAGVEIDDQRQQ